MKYGFIGCGNMGSAVARAIAKSTLDFAVTDRSGKAKAFAEEIGCKYTDIYDIAKNSTYVFLCVKPQMLAGVIKEIAPYIKDNQVLVSMAAGVTTEKITEYVGKPVSIIRIMPNTPVAIGKGVILFNDSVGVTEKASQDFLADMRYAGEIYHVANEKMFDPITSVSGCGPAYAYMFIEALADGAVSCGVPRGDALKYAAQTVLGAAEMVLQTGIHPAALKDAVCSPAGSTIEGVRVLEQQGFRSAVIDCIVAANNRNKELGK